MKKYMLKKKNIKITNKKYNGALLIFGSNYINPKKYNKKKYQLAFSKIKVVSIDSKCNINETINRLTTKHVNIFKTKSGHTELYFIKLKWDDSLLLNEKKNIYLYNETETYLTDKKFYCGIFNIDYNILFNLLLF